MPTIVVHGAFSRRSGSAGRCASSFGKNRFAIGLVDDDVGSASRSVKSRPRFSGISIVAK